LLHAGLPLGGHRPLETVALLQPAPIRRNVRPEIPGQTDIVGQPQHILPENPSQQPDVGGLLIELPRKPAFLIPLMGVRLDLLRQKAARHLAKGLVFADVEWAPRLFRSVDDLATAQPINARQYSDTSPRGIRSSNDQAAQDRPFQEGILPARYYSWIAHFGRRTADKPAAIDPVPTTRNQRNKTL